MHETSWYCTHCGAANNEHTQVCFACKQARSEFQEQLLHGRYQTVSVVGTGGFGMVYKAFDVQAANRVVAVKQIHMRGLPPQKVIEATDAFNREIQILTPLNNPHLPHIYDSFTDPEHWYLVMDYIEGETLEQYLEKRVQQRSYAGGLFLPFEEVMDIALQLCAVLDYLHMRHPPIIFRDLKPSNIMRTSRGHLYLIDFGIARYFKPGQAKDTVPFGSPGYAAPEQYGKAQTTPRADIYSLGALLHHLLSGDDPAETPFHFAPLPASNIPGIHDLERLIQHMVAIDSSKRPASIQEVKTALREIHRPEPRFQIWVPPPGQPLPPSSPMGQQMLAQQLSNTLQKRTNRRAVVGWLAIGGLVTLGMGGLGSLLRSIPHGDSVPGSVMSEPYDHHFHHITAMTLSPDANRIAFRMYDDTIQLAQITTEQIQAATSIDDARGNVLAWSADSNYLAIGASGGDIVIENGAYGSATRYLNGAPNGLTTLAWSPDGKALACYGAGEVQIIDSSSGNTLSHFITNTSPASPLLSWSPDSQYIVADYYSSESPSALQIWDMHQNKIHLILTVEESLSTVTWSPNGKYIAAASLSGAVYLWDPSNGQLTQKLTGVNGTNYQLVWSPSSDQLVQISYEGSLQFWYIPSGHAGFTGGIISAQLADYVWPPGSDRPIRAWTNDMEHVQITPLP
jgi:serine/threonine protein kinase